MSDRSSADAAELAAFVRAIPDFPQPGVLFRDISPLLRQRFDATLAALERLLASQEIRQIDAVAGIDARGFILGAGLAARLGKGFAPIRKAGKLPPPLEREEYNLEYGTGTLEMQHGSGRLLIVDDVLATGGTLRAAADLSERCGYSVLGLIVLIDLNLAPAPLWRGDAVRAVIRY